MRATEPKKGNRSNISYRIGYAAAAAAGLPDEGGGGNTDIVMDEKGLVSIHTGRANRYHQHPMATIQPWTHSNLGLVSRPRRTIVLFFITPANHTVCVCAHTLSKPSPIIHPSHFYPLRARSHTWTRALFQGVDGFSPLPPPPSLYSNP